MLVHGFIGWGRDELFGFKYWGGFGDVQEVLVESAVGHVEDRERGIDRLAVDGGDEDIDVPRFAEDAGVERKGLANHQGLRLRAPAEASAREEQGEPPDSHGRTG